MREFYFGCALGALLIGGMVVSMPHRDMDFPPEFKECVKVCEQKSPQDRGQGCIDIECNPLLDSED